jgi:two-component sensor histidine kinase
VKPFLADASIRYKLMAVVMTAIFMAMFILSATLIIYDLVTIKSSQVKDMETLADMVGSNSTAALSFSNPDDARETLEALRVKQHVVAGGIYDSDDRLFARYTRPGLADFTFPPAAQSPGYRFVDNSLEIFRDIDLEGENIGRVYLKADMGELRSRLNNFVMTVILATIIILLLAFVLVSRMQKIITGPILELTGVARMISDTKDYSIRVRNANHDELGFLVDKFNEMLDKIKNREEELKLAHMELEQRVVERTAELQHEVVQRRKAEQLIRASLEEKEVLLKEIHHRVKNNLQVISSLLSMQGRGIRDPEMLAKFKDSESRVKTMALIHEKLYRSDDLAKVDFADYVQNLTSYLRRSFMTSSQNVAIMNDIEAVKLGVDVAVPSGLIINELVSNSLKHAFPDNRRGKIIIDFREMAPGEYRLKVSDNGIGFPENFDLQRSNSLGMQLVTTLASQISGTLEIDRSEGTAFRLTFGELTIKQRKPQHV